ncbi:Arc family DNA binding domain-containing protein [Arachidicoccus soli]|uniref:Arc family DNA binding domain-containing protein n=1 Tax=Arachidicoccus soli TaxID=2341117 RepID=A0A386HRJ5_9BACT|nr:Arc family DNA binding domain-containing protein [Arachidicoccus soli]AYD48475.1 Arc family DNA binding domain-containing protein [Arachidicoccus soli]
MSDKKNLIIRIDSATHRTLATWAADDFRSINGQIEYLLNKALSDAGRLKNEENKALKSTKRVQKKE